MLFLLRYGHYCYCLWFWISFVILVLLCLVVSFVFGVFLDLDGLGMDRVYS